MYITIDGNNIGKVLERYILLEDVEKLSQFSQHLNEVIHLLHDRIVEKGGVIIFTGGDNIMAFFENDDFSDIIEETFNQETKDVCYSIGIGNSVLDSYLALKYAKAMYSRLPIFYDGKAFDTVKRGAC